MICKEGSLHKICINSDSKSIPKNGDALQEVFGNLYVQAFRAVYYVYGRLRI